MGWLDYALHGLETAGGVGLGIVGAGLTPFTAGLSAPLLAAGAGMATAGVSGLVGDHQADVANDAANKQFQATQDATGLQRDIYNQQRADLAPYNQIGVDALRRAYDLASNYQPFSFDPSKDDGYQFRLKEGLKAVQNSAATRGGLLSGATLKSLNDYAQGYASQERQNAFGNFMAERAARLNPLMALAGFGQNAVGQTNAAAQNYGTNAANLMVGGANALAEGRTGAANAQASGYVGGASALNSTLSNYLNYDQNQKLLNTLNTGSGSGWSQDNLPF